MKLTYAVVFEKSSDNYGAYSPDLPGCVSVGRTWDQALANIKEAIAFHIEGMHADGDPIPPPRRSAAEALAYHKATYPEALAVYPASAAELAQMGITDEPAAIRNITVEVDIAPAAVRWAAAAPLLPA